MPSTEREPLKQELDAEGLLREPGIENWIQDGAGRDAPLWVLHAGDILAISIGETLRALEDRLIRNLALEKNSKVLDAGCGAIDLIDHHLVKAQRNIKAFDVEGKVTASKGDYHHLENFADNSFNGAYTMETFVHATGPEKAAAEFFRIIRPGGSLAMYEYDHVDFSTKPEAVGKSWTCINKYSAMPAYDRFKHGVLEDILEKAGFEIITVEDISDNVLPNDANVLHIGIYTVHDYRSPWPKAQIHEYGRWL
ncbi:related to ERG6 S-adenosyl-methionine delta-24-sterol-c-methyltransferase [Rhynchosporium secalis]|uniref:Related to ERG6 S-adenosyl-methionine delta-24-sterol-c-methyltransferase n=1 Tax=Rhynchosporium secalis TaxID=38038 RepID=A0A1E1MDX0_RHYSE|nr:related to ERG6 S-adenosyl-methionine delta-24-sterol-c-methyltransferase [Rhynchosporium secalis]